MGKNTEPTEIYLGEETFVEDLASTEGGAETIAMRCQELEASDAWQFFKKMQRGTIAVYQRQVLDKKDLDGNVLTEADVDTLRERIVIIKGILDYPAQQIERYKENPGEGAVRNPNDPYA
jgi:hypothetical protein